MAEIHLTIEIADAGEREEQIPPSLAADVIERSLATRLAEGKFFESNWSIPVVRVGSYTIESGAIRREWRTPRGKILNEDDIQALADEAERGYDVSLIGKSPLRLAAQDEQGAS